MLFQNVIILTPKDILLVAQHFVLNNPYTVRTDIPELTHPDMITILKKERRRNK
jgi:hypothetical protein